MLKLKPQESFVIVFSDETAEDRSESYIKEMFESIRGTVNDFGYDIQSYGSYDMMVKFFRKVQTLKEVKSELFGDQNDSINR